MVRSGRNSSAGLTRRSLLAGVGAAGSAPILAASVTPAMAKVSQAAVGYQNTPKNGQSCGDCNLFLPPSACKTVAGAVSPNGWCKIWVHRVG
ncbi:MAG: high-potential iron-sulfur protein [Roseiarcus sp.]